MRIWYTVLANCTFEAEPWVKIPKPSFEPTAPTISRMRLTHRTKPVARHPVKTPNLHPTNRLCLFLCSKQSFHFWYTKDTLRGVRSEGRVTSRLSLGFAKELYEVESNRLLFSAMELLN
jgi:hypothetical protein